MSGEWVGIYRGIVTNNNDPEGLGRVKAICPQVFGNDTTETAWAWPAVAPGVATSTPNTPIPFVGVWLMFEGGDLDYPIWTGVWNTAARSGSVPGAGIGPQGPPGSPGATGPQGPAGPSIVSTQPLSGANTSPVGISGPNIPTVVMTTASIPVGVWLISMAASVQSATNQLCASNAALGSATATFSGQFAAEGVCNAAASVTEITVAFIATITVAGTLVYGITLSGAAGTVNANSLETGSPAITAWSAVPIVGIQGAQGVQGPAGLGGVTILTHAGVPISADGAFALGSQAIDTVGVLFICTSAGTPGTWKCPPGQILSTRQYAPSPRTFLTFSNTGALQAVDSTNFTSAPFVVPPSGNVDIEVSVWGVIQPSGSSSAALELGLLLHGTVTQVGFTQMAIYLTSEAAGGGLQAGSPVSMTFHLTGQTPGATMQLDLGVTTSGGGPAYGISAFGTTGNQSVGVTGGSPFLIRALSA